ncbi:MAG: hypothetical protein ATN35_03905 [Epulopiscium sp. Nele67-Bin004]|nr:MAG: hypothetical protein ATN35_03905 [Epulopiscium sp. Nele67-Bin004]
MATAFDYSNWKQEVINGKTFCMAPPTGRHNEIMGNLYLEFANYLKGKRCKAFIELGIYLEEGNTTDYVVPDLSIICDKDTRNLTKFEGVPDLIVEVLSTNSKHDKVTKYVLYEKVGVQEYWIVDPKSKTIDQYILIDGKYTPINTFTMLSDVEIADLSDEDKKEYTTIIKPTILADLEINITDIFEY